jgi:hypothetical protein
VWRRGRRPRADRGGHDLILAETRFFRDSLVLAALAAGACFPAYDLPPGTPLPEGGLVSPAGVTVELAGAPLDVELCPAPGAALVLARSRQGGSLLQMITLDPVRALDPVPVPDGAARVKSYARGTSAILLTAGGLSFFHVSARGLEADGELALGEGTAAGDASAALLAIDAARDTAYAVRAGDRTMDIVDLAARRARAVPLPASVRALAIAEGGARAAIAPDGEAALLLLRPETGSVLERVALSAPACALAFDDPGDRLFVALADRTVVQVVDVMTVSLAGEGRSEATAASASPAMAYDPARARLYTTNDRDHCVIVWSVAQESSPSVLGLIPTGYRPRALAVSGHRLLVLSASVPPADGSILQILPAPATQDLAFGTATVRRNARTSHPPETK